VTHFPNTAERIAARGGRLVLAGHTHAGQVSARRLAGAFARLGGSRYLAGWYQVGGARLYVSAGIGSNLVRWRLGQGAWPEVGVFDLEGEAPAAKPLA
jgi:uncharacterized protein